MPELTFAVTSAAPLTYAAVPTMNFTLEVANAAAATQVHSGILRCQIQIEPARRRYDAGEQARLADLFGEPERWGRTLNPLLWTHATLCLPSFADRTAVELPIPCSFDFNLAATKYFDGLQAEAIPLNFLFSGTVFYTGGDAGSLQVAPISWDCEARFRLPAASWRALMAHYYPNGAWLRVRQDTFERLAAFKRERTLPTWDAALEHLLDERRAGVRS